MMASLRCNMDVKMLTNGQDVRACVFYITDYITKSELSIHDSISIVKGALEKCEASLYPRKMNPDLSVEENLGRQRMFTCLNVIDSNVERQAQWVTHSLLKRPLEYTTHKFCCLNAFNFMSAINRHLDPVSAPPTEVTVPIFNDEASPSSVVQATNKRIDYMHRCPTVNCMRFVFNESVPKFL